MGAKTWMLVYADGDAASLLKSDPALDREASRALATKLFPDEELVEQDDGNLCFTNPPDDELLVGCFPGLSIIAAGEFGLDYPSELPAPFIEAAEGRTVTLHAMHSVVDWFAFAIWEKGELMRALSLSPDSGILEDIGQRRRFEEPYWSGEHQAIDPEEDDEYPFDFHPLDLGEATLLNRFGYVIEGMVDDSQVDPESIPLMSFRRSPTKKPWWKFW